MLRSGRSHLYSGRVSAYSLCAGVDLVSGASGLTAEQMVDQQAALG